MYLKVHALWTERRNPVRASSELLRMPLPRALQVNTQQILCRFMVTYPTKYKRFRVTCPRSPFGWAHAPLRTNEELAMAVEGREPLRANVMALRRQRRAAGGSSEGRPGMAANLRNVHPSRRTAVHRVDPMARGCGVTDRTSGTGAVYLARELRRDGVLGSSKTRPFRRYERPTANGRILPVARW